MAKMIKSSRRRRSSGGIAKKAVSAARRVVYKTKKIYRSAKGVTLTPKDIAISVAAGGVGAIGAAVVLKKINAGSDQTDKGKGTMYIAKNVAVAAAGGFLAYKGMKKKQFAIASAGLGMSAVAAANIIGKFMPATGKTAAAPYQRAITFAAPLNRKNLVAAPYTVSGGKVRDLSEMI